MGSKKKMWYSILTRDEYKGDAPVFYDTHDFGWNESLEANYAAIYDELRSYLRAGESLQAYFDQTKVSKTNSWKTIALMAWGVKFHKRMSFFPDTMKVLSQIPGLVSVSFNLLEPHSEIVPHFGDTNGIMRCHYGLDIPAGLPDVGFRVKEEERRWENGKLLVFCDGYVHSAWNNSDRPRFILLFDVILPEFESRKNGICAAILSSLFIQSNATKLGIKREPSRWIVLCLFFFFKAAAFASRPVYNFFGRLFYSHENKKTIL